MLSKDHTIQIKKLKKQMKLLKRMCEIHAPSGEESSMSKFLLSHIKKIKNTGKKNPLCIMVMNFKIILF